MAIYPLLLVVTDYGGRLLRCGLLFAVTDTDTGFTVAVRLRCYVGRRCYCVTVIYSVASVFDYRTGPNHVVLIGV